MVRTGFRTQEVRRLAEQITEKLAQREDELLQAKGEVTVRIFKRGAGYDINLVLTY
jgi:hypothetical protein